MTDSRQTKPVEIKLVDDAGTAHWTILWDPKESRIVKHDEKC